MICSDSLQEKVHKNQGTDTKLDAHSLLMHEWAETSDRQFVDSGVVSTGNKDQVDEEGTEALINEKESFTLQQQKL